MTQPDDNSMQERAALYAAGALTGTERDEFERLLASGESELTAEVERMQSAMEAVAGAAPTAPVRPAVKDRLLAAARKSKFPGFEEPEPGVHVLRAGNGVWRETGYPGVACKVLHVEPGTRMATTVLRFAPGAKYPPHHHTQLEQCLVLSGDVRLGDRVHIFAGDYEKADAGTEHAYLTSDTGCELLIVSCLEDEILTR